MAESIQDQSRGGFLPNSQRVMLFSATPRVSARASRDRPRASRRHFSSIAFMAQPSAFWSAGSSWSVTPYS